MFSHRLTRDQHRHKQAYFDFGVKRVFILTKSFAGSRGGFSKEPLAAGGIRIIEEVADG